MTDQRHPEQPRRRGRTRWLLTFPTLGLAAVALAVVALELAAPEVDPTDRRVDGVPVLASEDERSCTRQAGEELANELRDAFPPEGRVSSTQAYLCPSAYDGLTVTFVGEVVGEILPRQGGAWAQVNDDAYALEHGPLIAHRERAGFNAGMSVWLPDGFHERIDGVGRFERRGDVILIRGTLHQADPLDGGGLTIRAEEMEILAASTEVRDPIHVPQLVTAVALALFAVAGLVWLRWSRARR